MKKKLIFAASCAAFAAFAGVPIKWSVETSRAEERVIDVYHGESLDMEVTFKTYGQILELPTNEVAATFWQTNGMNTAYWRTNNVEIIASNGVMRTTFGPEQDVGAKTLRGFIGIPGQIYRAAFVLRFKDAPGYNVSIVEWPYRLLDFSAIEVVNAPYYTKDEMGGWTTNTVDREFIERAVGIDYIALPFEHGKEYEEDDVVIINNLFYRFNQKWRSFWTGDPIAEECVDRITNFSELGGAMFAKEFLPIGRGGTNSPTYKMIDAGYENGRRAYFVIEPCGIGFKDEYGGTFRMVGDELRYTEGTYLYERRIRDLLTKNSILPMNSTYVGENYKQSPTSPYYVYVYLTNNYLTAITVDSQYLKKSDAASTYLSKTDAASTYSTPAGVATAIAGAINDVKPQYLYNSSGELRQRYDGKLQRKTHNGWYVAFTNENNGLVLHWSNPNKWVCYDTPIGTLNFERANGRISCTQYPQIHYDEEYDGECVITLAPLGTFYAFMESSYGSFYWEDYGQFAKQSEVDFTTNNTTLVSTIGAVASVEETDPTVPEWAKEDNKPTYTAGEVGAYSATSGATLEGNVSTIGSQLNTIGSTLNAEDAKFEITNYNSVVHMPEASFSVKVQNESTGSNEWIVGWQEMTRWNKFTGVGFNWATWTGFYAWSTNLDERISNKSEREYAFYDGVTGNPAPDGFFWISQPRVAICAGMAYQRYADAQGEVWVLESNGMVAEVNGTTNGFFRITDSENEVQFEIIKGNKRTLAAAPRTMTSQVMGITHYFTSYATTNAVSNPVARFRRDLQSGSWIDETDLDCPCNTSWTDKGGGIYECEWWPKSTEPRMFMTAVYETGGSTRIVQHAPVEMQKIIIGGVEYTIGTATISGQTVLTLTP